MKRLRSAIWLTAALVLIIFAVNLQKIVPPEAPNYSNSSLLIDPFLQLPTRDSVRVVWFTDFPGSAHHVVYGKKLNQTALATTTKMSRLREDHKSKLASGSVDTQQPITREIWRHEAIVTGLSPGKRFPYRVISKREQETPAEISSREFTLSSLPKPGTPVQILLTSDHQLMPMTAANLEKVVETVGQVDAVFMAGDLVNIPDRASEWFDDSRGGAFFPALQGRAHYNLAGKGEAVAKIYRGGELIQYAPLFTVIGNHEVMGQFSSQEDLNAQFNNSYPRQIAQKNYEASAAQINPGEDPLVKQAWIKANSYNTDTYQEMFTLPQSISGGEQYYATTFGDVRLIALYVTNMWRKPGFDPKVRGRYREREQDLDRRQNWGYGQHIFGEIRQGSPQYRWLEQELNSDEFKRAKYKVVMFHHPPHSLGGNAVPPYTNPLPVVERAPDGRIESLRYDYPPERDFISRDLIPLLESAGVQLVYYGHSHLWNRFLSPSGTNYLESSNVGNSYGAHWGENRRPILSVDNSPDYAAIGDPNGLEPIVPNLAPLTDETGQPLPYIASNEITVFSILDTKDGTVSSYRFEPHQPESTVIKFDQFSLVGDPKTKGQRNR